MFRGILRHLSTADGQRDVVRLTKGFYKDLIAIGFRAAQMMIEVGGSNGDAQLLAQRIQAPQHRHGVRAAGDRAQDVVSLGKQGFVSTPRGDLSLHCGATPGLQRW